MALQGAKQQQAEHRRVGAWTDSIAGDMRENPVVVPLTGELLDGVQELAQRSLLGEDGRIEGSLGGEILKDQCFADAGGAGDFLGRGAFKPLGRKQSRGGGDQGGLPITARIARKGRSCVHNLR